MTNVIVLSGAVSYNACHVEVFADTEAGLHMAENRKAELQALNSTGWKIRIERFGVKGEFLVKERIENK
jgi:hypothetical protein